MNGKEEAVAGDREEGPIYQTRGSGLGTGEP